MTTTSHPSTAVAPAEAHDPATRIRVVAGAMFAAAATIAGLLVTTPWGDRYDSGAEEIVSFDSLPVDRGSAWTGMLADGFAFAVLGITLGLVTCHLVRRRGRLAALVGATLTTAGGILFAMGGLAFATFIWFTSGVTEDTGRALVDYANDHPGHLVGATMAGYLLFTLGTLVVSTALIRARAVPVLGVAAYVVLIVVQFAPLPGRALDFLQIAMMGLICGLAVMVIRRPSVGGLRDGRR